nr:MAG TPA: CRISPR-associated endonuclease [Caudoviricetes sp.]
MTRKTLRTKRWRNFRISIMVRDKFLCQESLRYGKKVAAVVVHHIFPVSEYPELEFVSWNCISLSIHEHNKMHNRVDNKITRKGKKWQAKRKKEFEKFYSSKKIF